MKIIGNLFKARALLFLSWISLILPISMVTYFLLTIMKLINCVREMPAGNSDNNPEISDLIWRAILLLFVIVFSSIILSLLIREKTKHYRIVKRCSSEIKIFGNSYC